MMPVIDPAAVRLRTAVSGPAIAEGRILGGGRGRLKGALADRAHADNDGVRRGADRFPKQVDAIVGRIVGMRVEAHQVAEAFAELADREIDGDALQAAGIVR